MGDFGFSLTNSTLHEVGAERTQIVQVSDFFTAPERVRDAAAAKSYARINPHYPGVRAEVEPELLDGLCQCVGSLMAEYGQAPEAAWQGQAWYSIVTNPAQQLTPIQRLPHFDGFDPSQVAVMIYLNETGHGGTGFFQQVSTGFERVTETRFPAYKEHLEREVRAAGLPPARYTTDGGPHFKLIADLGAAFNSLILYPGTALHSGLIDNALPLSSNPKEGRLTINGFFRPA